MSFASCRTLSVSVTLHTDSSKYGFGKVHFQFFTFRIRQRNKSLLKLKRRVHTTLVTFSYIVISSDLPGPAWPKSPSFHLTLP